MSSCLDASKVYCPRNDFTSGYCFTITYYQNTILYGDPGSNPYNGLID
jgi:hypothetical protein